MYNMSMPNHDKVAIDFNRREPEAEWIVIIDRFALSFTPIWFNVLSWVLMLGALNYIYKIEHQKILGFVLAISYSLLYIYLSAQLFRLKFTGLPLTSKLSNRIKLLLSLTISGLAVLLILQLIGVVIDLLSKYK